MQYSPIIPSLSQKWLATRIGRDPRMKERREERAQQFSVGRRRRRRVSSRSSVTKSAFSQLKQDKGDLAREQRGIPNQIVQSPHSAFGQGGSQNPSVTAWLTKTRLGATCVSFLIHLGVDAPTGGPKICLRFPGFSVGHQIW